MLRDMVIGEASSSKVAAVYDSRLHARSAADQLLRVLDLDRAQVRMLAPGDHGVGRQLEPETRGIGRTLVRAHLALGAIGTVAGGLVFLAFRAQQAPWLMSSPVLTAGAMLFLGLIAGLLAGGLVALRPDHDAYLFKVSEALQSGRYAVVVHALSRDQRASTIRLLERNSDEVVATL